MAALTIFDRVSAPGFFGPSATSPLGLLAFSGFVGALADGFEVAPVPIRFVEPSEAGPVPEITATDLSGFAAGLSEPLPRRACSMMPFPLAVWRELSGVVVADFGGLSLAIGVATPVFGFAPPKPRAWSMTFEPLPGCVVVAEPTEVPVVGFDVALDAEAGADAFGFVAAGVFNGLFFEPPAGLSVWAVSMILDDSAGDRSRFPVVGAVSDGRRDPVLPVFDGG